MGDVLYVAGVVILIVAGFLYGRWIRTLDREYFTEIAKIEAERIRIEKEYAAKVEAINQQYEQRAEQRMIEMRKLFDELER